MKRYLLLLAACATFHAAPAQLLNRLKEKAAGAVQSVGVPAVGDKAQRAVESTASDAAKTVRRTGKQAIIFSKEPIKDGQTTSTATDFGPTDNIYARVFMPVSFATSLAQHGKEDQPKVIAHVQISTSKRNTIGQEQLQAVYCDFTILPADYNKTSFDFDILPAAGNIRTQYEGAGGVRDHPSTIFREFGAESPAPTFPFGKRTFTVEFGDNNELVGDFTMAVNGWPEQKPLLARINGILKGQASAEAKTTKLPAVFKAPGRFSDPQLSTAALKQKLGPETIRFAVEPGSVDYEIHKNALGVPEYKLSRAIWTVEKDKDGNCYYTRYYLRREYEGGGKYGPLDFATTTASKTPIACENAK